jgi:hypothetical protein
MAQLTGITQDGIEVPVQVKPDGRLVAEGLDGPPGPTGPTGPTGPAGPAGDSQFQKTGGDVYLSSGRFLVGTPSFPFSATAVFQGNSFESTGSGILGLYCGTTSLADGAALGIIVFGDSGHGDAAYVRCLRDGGTWNTSTSRPTRLSFSTTRDGEDYAREAFQIDSQQRVKIKSPNGSWWAITVSDSGDLTAVAA